MHDKLQRLYFMLKDARSQLEMAEFEAAALGLPGTKYEIDKAISDVRSCMFEIERGVEDEFKQFAQCSG